LDVGKIKKAIYTLKQQRRALITIILSLTLLCLLGGFVFSNPLETNTISVVDFRGRKIEVKKPVTRIVCLIESALSGLYMLGVGEKVVGISTNVYSSGVFSHYARLDERIRSRKLPAPGNWDFVNIESVVSLKPDLVIIWAHQAESIKALEERGISVYGVFLENKDDVYTEIFHLGKLTGREKRAAYLIQYTKNEIARVEKMVQAIPSSQYPRVYYMWAQGNLETSCGGSTVNDLITLAGGRNVCSDLPREHIVVNMENLLTWNPDMIVMWYNEKKDPHDIIRDSQWSAIKAVKERRVYEFNDVFHHDLWTLKFQYAAKVVAKWSHPGIFKNMDLEQEKVKIINTLYGSDKGNKKRKKL
jgi:iron complex transport system substrate-binding protein